VAPPVNIDVWTDGSIKGGNPGGHGVGGYVIKDKRLPPTVITGTIDLGKSDTMTNNIAEYSAVVAALEELYNNAYKHDRWPDLVVIHSDSKLVVEQCNDNWVCGNTRLRGLRQQIWNLCEELGGCDVRFKWIPREENTEADEVSRSLYED
jgi:ribonuclease HI